MTEFAAGPLPEGMKPIPNGDKPASVMTKRELIAAAAMQGLLGIPECAAKSSPWVAEHACNFADALLWQLDRP